VETVPERIKPRESGRQSSTNKIFWLNFNQATMAKKKNKNKAKQKTSAGPMEIGPGIVTQNFGRWDVIQSNRTPEEQAALMEATKEFRRNFPKQMAEKVSELEGLPAKHNSFELLANLTLGRLFINPETYKEPTHPRLKNADRQAALLFADEARFRQDPSLYQTWARRGPQPLMLTTGQRNPRKIFGAVDWYRPKFYYGHGEVFEGRSYTAFLDGLAQRDRRQEGFLIQDHAAYPRAPEVREGLTCYGHRFHLCPLPKYSSEFNAVEPLWHYSSFR
jgi:hypothetical protein